MTKRPGPTGAAVSHGPGAPAASTVPAGPPDQGRRRRGPAWTARVSPLTLKTSQTIRLARLFKGAVYKEPVEQLMMPIPKTPDLAGTLVTFLRQLIPVSPDDRRSPGEP